MTTLRFASTAAALLLVACTPTPPAVPPAPLPGTAPVAREIRAGDVTMGIIRDPRIAVALDDMSPARIRATDSVLVSFQNRNTLSDTTSDTRGIGAARRWIFAQLSSVSAACDSCLRIEYDAAVMPVPRLEGRTVNVVNVLAWLPGRDAKRVVVIGGHYDSCVCSLPGGRFDTLATAPGADDDGSGSSAVMELARGFAKHFPRGLDATVIFALYAGEEQGLMGSTHLAERLAREGYRVEAAFTNDIVGNVVAENGATDSATVRIYAADPDNSPSRELGRYGWAIGRTYLSNFTVMPTWRLDRIGRGGDHRPFVEQGHAGLRVTERLENYKRQHLPTDDLEHVNFGYVANVARFDFATIASLAMAPQTPDSAIARRENAASGGQAWQLSWQRSPRAVGYEVLVRRTTSPTWERVYAVGDTTSFTLGSQLDDEWAAVRAIGSDGHRSLGASLPAPAGPAVLARPATGVSPVAPRP